MYGRVTPELARGYPGLSRPEEVPDDTGDITSSGLFSMVAVRRYVWDQEYEAEGYVRLLSTYSDHLALPPERRQRLFDGIRRLIEERYGGRIVKGYMNVLKVAERV